jgi:hypothetical protein
MNIKRENFEELIKPFNVWRLSSSQRDCDERFYSNTDINYSMLPRAFAEEFLGLGYPKYNDYEDTMLMASILCREYVMEYKRGKDRENYMFRIHLRKDYNDTGVKSYMEDNEKIHVFSFIGETLYQNY